jgi:hypothetical protein
MKKFLLLEPNAPAARAGQDKIYQWEVAKPKVDYARLPALTYKALNAACRSGETFICPPAP